MKAINAVIVTGNWASGKTELTSALSQFLVRGNIPFVLDSDRIRFEDAVLKDTIEQRGAIRVGPHSYLTEDGPPGKRKFMVRDGLIPNIAHREMISDIAKIGSHGPFRLLEYAVGPSIYEFEGEKREPPFLQEGKYLLEWLGEFGVLNKVLIVELLARVSIRYQRQKVRGDATDFVAFSSFAGDGGELIRYKQQLGSKYIPFDNGDNGLQVFYDKARTIYESFISPEVGKERETFRGVEFEK